MKTIVNKLVIISILIPALLALLICNITVAIWIGFKHWWEELVIKHLINNGQNSE